MNFETSSDHSNEVARSSLVEKISDTESVGARDQREARGKSDRSPESVATRVGEIQACAEAECTLLDRNIHDGITSDTPPLWGLLRRMRLGYSLNMGWTDRSPESDVNQRHFWRRFKRNLAASRRGLRQVRLRGQLRLVRRRKEIRLRTTCLISRMFQGLNR
jgi:hypothetical protein